MSKKKKKRYCGSKTLSDTIACLIQKGLTEQQARDHMKWYLETTGMTKETEDYYFDGRVYWPKLISKNLITVLQKQKEK